jgi:hypothetical protein
MRNILNREGGKGDICIGWRRGVPSVRGLLADRYRSGGFTSGMQSSFGVQLGYSQIKPLYEYGRLHCKAGENKDGF